MAENHDMANKAARLRGLVDELASYVETSLARATGPAAAPGGVSVTGEAAVVSAAAFRRFDCGDYTCHGHFTCSSFGCGSQFKLAD